MRRLLLLLSALLLGGCYFSGGTAYGTTPEPHTHLAPQNERIGLLLPANLPNDFDAPSEFHVRDFVGTLRRGFYRGFGDAYLVDTEDDERYLELTAIEVWFEPVEHEHTRHVTWVNYVARIHYRARLLDGNRNEIGRYTGVASSKEMESGGTGSTLLKSAVESMYEDIADHLFWAQKTA